MAETVVLHGLLVRYTAYDATRMPDLDTSRLAGTYPMISQVLCGSHNRFRLPLFLCQLCFGAKLVDCHVKTGKLLLKRRIHRM